MSGAATKIGQIKQLREQAAGLRGASQRWAEKYADRKHYDKQGFGFTLRTDFCGAFKIPPMGFEAYVGTYGSSSVGTAWRVEQDLINRLLPKALNIHKQAIFDTIAQLAEAEAADLLQGARAELASMQELLSEVEPTVSVEVSA